MKHLNAEKRIFIAACITLTIFFASGCAGPSTKVLPREDADPGPEYEIVIPELEKADPHYLEETLKKLSSQPRPIGSFGQEEAQRYITGLFESYGYEVETTGGTISAVKNITAETGNDILLISANYGSGMQCPGAYDNASGVSVLLELARIVSTAPTDTQLQFVCFPGTNEELFPVKNFLEQKTGSDLKWMLGAVQLGPLGRYGETPLLFITSSGKDTFLGNYIKNFMEADEKDAVCTVAGDETISSAMERNRIPAVCIREQGSILEQGSFAETGELVSAQRLAELTDQLGMAVSALMDVHSPSMQAKAHYFNDIRDQAYTQRRDTVFPFGEKHEKVDAQIGMEGILTVKNKDNAGKELDAYRYPMKWFDIDQIILTDYYYLEDQLEEIHLNADGAGVEFEDARERIISVYGECTGFSDTPAGTEYEWAVPERRFKIQLLPGHDKYELVFSEYDTPKTMIEDDPSGLEQLKTLAARVVLPEDYETLKFCLYTDGIGKTKGFLEENQLGIDWADAARENMLVDEAETMRLLIGLYGKLLQEKEPERYAQQNLEMELLSFVLRSDSAIEEETVPQEIFSSLAEFEELETYRLWFRQQLRR